MKIRRATFSDVPALVSLNRVVHAMHVGAHPEIFRQNPPKEVVGGAFRKAMELPHSFWLLAEEDEPVAFLSAEFREREETWYAMARRMCRLSGFVVAPHFRRQGIARDMLSVLRAEASSRGITRIEVEVWNFNADAIEVYAHLGFNPIMERMSLSLDRPNHSPEPTAVAPCISSL